MIVLYILFNIFLYYYSRSIFKQVINPITIYGFIWLTMIILYEMKLVKYYDLTFTTWCVIFIFQSAYSFGCILGHARYKKYPATKANEKELLALNLASKKIEQRLKLVILSLAAISALGIIPNIFILIGNYGANIFQITNQIYNDRLTGNRNFELIPYIGTVIHMSVILSGIYINRFGMKKFLVIPVLLLIINMLPSGGRSDFILGFLYIVFPILISKGKQKITKKKLLGLMVILSCLMVVFAIITNNRSSWITVNSYMSPIMVKLVDFNPALYKIYTYISLPVGVLNAYLKDPVYDFGLNSFGAFINVFNKFGAGLNYQRYQDAYTIPILANVGTYIRELIQDFTLIGGVLVIILIGFLIGRSFLNLKRENTFMSEIFVTLFSVIIFMSFFVWYYRETVFWISTFLGLFLGIYLDRYSRKQFMKFTMEYKTD